MYIVHTVYINIQFVHFCSKLPTSGQTKTVQSIKTRQIGTESTRWGNPKKLFQLSKMTQNGFEGGG